MGEELHEGVARIETVVGVAVPMGNRDDGKPRVSDGNGVAEQPDLGRHLQERRRGEHIVDLAIAPTHRDHDLGRPARSPRRQTPTREDTPAV